MSDTPSSATPSKNHYDHDPLSALDAIGEAQRIAFAPILFQAAVCLRDLGILRQLEQRGDAGATRHELAEACSLSDYGAGVLLDMGLSGRLVFQQGEKFFLAKTGHFLLNDKMTRVNMDFTRDICYAGMARLKEAVTAGTPAGLEVFGKWPTIYPALSSLPEPAKTSWFAFDHFYSDCAFGPALAHVFQYKPALIYDVGGNTGRWALRCVAHDPDVRVTVLDLPQQVALLKKETAAAPNGERIDGIGLDILGEGDLPGEADVWWMSQFLDCFSEEQVERILHRIRRALKPSARVCILEPFCDRQTFETGAAVLNAFSLYFTCLANGNSRFFRAAALLGRLERSGFEVEREINGVGFGGHTLLVCVAA